MDIDVWDLKQTRPVPVTVNLLINPVIDWTEKRTEGQITITAGIRTHYLTDISKYMQIPLMMDTNQGVTGTAMSISNQRYQYSPIDQSVNQLINKRIDKTNGGTHQ